MAPLKLLYCDSAGVRRCRVLVCEGDIPNAIGLTSSSAGGASAGQPASGQASLEFTPSIALAAAAGCIPTPAGQQAKLQTSKSLGRVAEDKVLSPEASQERVTTTGSTTLDAAAQEQQQQPQQAEPAAPEQPQQPQQVSGGTTPTLPKLGSFCTALRPSPSMILAAAAGAIAVPDGAHISRFASSNSLDELSGMTAVPDYNYSYPQGALQSQPSGTAIGVPAGLSPSPSMMLAAAAGAITLTPGSNSSSRHQSPSRLGPSAAAMLGQQQQQQQSPQQQAAALTRLSPAKPRPLISAFLRSPLSLSSSALGTAAGAAALSVAANFSVGLTKACMGQPAFADMVVEASGLAPVGEVLLVPDLAAAVPGVCGQGGLMAPVDMMEKDLSASWSCCPRSALKRALTALESRFGLTLLAGFELEFVLLQPANLDLFKVFPEAAAGANVMLSGGQAWVPVDSSIYGQASAMSASASAVMQEVVAQLQEMGIGVVQYHPEAAPGQFEIALSPDSALLAADKLLFAREVIASIVSSHGLAVTWLPKPMAGHAGSGCHLHFSLWRGGDSVMADAAAAVAGGAGQLPPGSYPLTATANSFLAGVLDHLPALLPFTAPSLNSYDRLQPCCWSGAFLCWGYDNREAPLRVCCPRGGPQGANAELKAFDGSTNPYIGLAAVVAAGMQGLEEGSRLPAALQLDPGTTGNAAVRSKLQQLPASLTDALKCWDSDSKLQAAVQGVLGADLIKAFIAVRHCEVEANPKPQDLLLRY